MLTASTTPEPTTAEDLSDRTFVAQMAPHNSSLWPVVAFACAGALLMASVGLALLCLHRVTLTHQRVEDAMLEVEQKLHKLDAGISFDARRRHVLLSIRDEIMRTNAKLSLHEAYDYAQHLLTATEKYPAIDPLLFLAIGIVESGFDPQATSHADAKGLFQIWPATGRLLARVLDWEYTDEMLYEPQKNTEMAALYLDILFSTYRDKDMVLAEYNGGPINAGYLRAGSNRAADETRDYVAKVGHTYESLKTRFDRGFDVRASDMHRDANRNGKSLAD